MGRLGSCDRRHFSRRCRIGCELFAVECRTNELTLHDNGLKTGFAFRLTSTFIIYQTQAIKDMDVLQTERTSFRRSMSYREASTFSFIEYMYAFVERNAGNAVIIFRFDDIDNAITTLQQKNVSILTGEKLYSL